MSVKTIYIDTETTGLNARRGGIIQLAAILDIDGQEIDSIFQRVAP